MINKKEYNINLIGYNRPDSFKSTLYNLSNTFYPNGIIINLIIHLDYCDEEMLKKHLHILEQLVWPYGDITLNSNSYNKGLRTQIESVIDNSSDEWIIMFEDDLELSPLWFKYFLQTMETIQRLDISHVLGVSFYSYLISEVTYQNFTVINPESYLMNIAASWGFAINKKEWITYRNATNYKNVDLPKRIKKWGDNSWKKELIRYMIFDNKYYVFPPRSYSSPSGTSGTNVRSNKNLFVTPITTYVDRGNIDTNNVYSVTGYKIVNIRLQGNMVSAEIDLYADLNYSTLEYVLSPIKSKIKYSISDSDRTYLESLGISLYLHSSVEYFQIKRKSKYKSHRHKFRYYTFYDVLSTLVRW
jgi:hypothetical protein